MGNPLLGDSINKAIARKGTGITEDSDLDSCRESELLNMQQNGKLCFAQWLLVVALSWHAVDVSVGHPVKRDVGLVSVDMESCVWHARALLSNMTEALRTAATAEDPAKCSGECEIDRTSGSTSGDLFGGINCTGLSAEMNSGTQTTSACEPKHQLESPLESVLQNTSCQRNTEFNKTECLENIERDARYYRSALLAYAGRALGDQLVQTIDDFTEVPPVIGNAFDRRLQLCKEMKGLQVRATTINRVMSYIAAGDYRM